MRLMLTLRSPSKTLSVVSIKPSMATTHDDALGLIMALKPAAWILQKSA
jgi:hypothetical protein